MKTGDPTAPGRSAFVVVPGRGFDWGIDATHVAEVMPPGQVAERECTDLATLSGDARGVDGTGRVIAISTSRGLCFVKTGGAISIRQVDRAKVCDLPPAVRAGVAGEVLSGVVFSDGEPPLLVIDVEGLWKEAGSR